MTSITLTEDQETALGDFVQFLSNPDQPVFVLQGYSGTGKTTLVKELLDRLPKLIKATKLLCPSFPNYYTEFSATTNKAAESFAGIIGRPVPTIHSLLGLRVVQNHMKKTSRLEPKKNAMPLEGAILFIDEASYIDKGLLEWIFALSKKCKIVFMGDPAQLAPVQSRGTPVFDAGFPTAMLSKVVRQAEGNPIIDLSTRFRETVTSGEFFSFTPDGVHIQYLPQEEFEDAIIAECLRQDWKYTDSKILAYTNARVVQYNLALRKRLNGDPKFQPGDYAICNKFVTGSGGSLKTDELVLINDIEPESKEHGVTGHFYRVNGLRLFGPNSLADKKELLKGARAEDAYQVVQNVEDNWVDLRAAYSCTVNKSQGSTFDKVFIDLNDIRRCTNGEQLARMLYVAVSRARYQVILTGDLV